MSLHILSSPMVDPVGSDARSPVIVVFLVVIGASLLWLFTLATAHEDNPESFYVANRSLSPSFNGFAMAGEQITVISLLAIPGAIALFGYDGFTVAIDTLIALGVLLLLAQKTRNSGRYTLGEIFSLRASGAAPRIAASLVTLTITIPLILLQLRAAGISTALLIGLSTDGAQVVCTVLIGFLVACFASVADLRGISFMQIVKVPITLVTLAVLSLLALRKFAWDPGNLLSAAAEKSVAPEGFLSPGLWPYATSLGSLNLFGEHIIVILGSAMMPHLLLRIGASRSGRSARRSMTIAAGLTGFYFLLLIATGLAAAAVVGSRDIAAVDAIGQSSPILLASDLLPHDSTARIALITVMASVAFLTVLTTVASVTFAAAAAFAHDVFARGKHPRTDTGEVRALRLAVVILCAVGLSLSAATHRYPLEFLVAFSLNVAASCIFPVLIYSFFWRGFNRAGLMWSVYGGLLLCVILTIFSPSFSGNAYALLPESNFDWYPFQAPGMVSLPAAFLLGWIASIKSPGSPEIDFRRVEHKILTGRGDGFSD